MWSGLMGLFAKNLLLYFAHLENHWSRRSRVPWLEMAWLHHMVERKILFIPWPYRILFSFFVWSWATQNKYNRIEDRGVDEINGKCLLFVAMSSTASGERVIFNILSLSQNTNKKMVFFCHKFSHGPTCNLLRFLSTWNFKYFTFYAENYDCVKFRWKCAKLRNGHYSIHLFSALTLLKFKRAGVPPLGSGGHFVYQKAFSVKIIFFLQPESAKSFFVQ